MHFDAKDKWEEETKYILFKAELFWFTDESRTENGT